MTSKVLALLEAFSPSGGELTLSDLARRAGVSLSTAHRRAAELVAWGALERGPGGAYRIGLRLWEIGSLAPRGFGLREIAMPFLEDRYEVTHEHVHLAVRDHLDVVFVERISGREASIPVLSRAGGRIGQFATGAGLVLLAHAPPDVQEEVLNSPIPRYTKNTITDPPGCGPPWPASAATATPPATA